AVQAKVAQFPRSGIPLGASPRIVAEPDRQRRIWTRPLESTTRSYRSPDGVSRRVKPFSGEPNPTRRASIRQSAHVTPPGTARSSWSRPAFARESVIQKPARMVQFGPRPDASFRLKSSENKTVPGAGPPPLPASAPASAPPPSAPPPVPASAPASGVPPPASAPPSGVIPPP